jgi:histidinol-phosphate/aromatic aminotransferase/cobyric acid decarboxylase-like protein
MRIEPVAYLEWTKLHKRGRIHLSPSGIPDRTLQELGFDSAELKIAGVNPYGYAELLGALSARYGVPEDNIFTTVGVSLAIFMVCAALLDPGDRILVEKPAYEPLLAAPRLLGPDIVRLERRFEDGYGIDFDRYQRALAGRPKLVVLRNLHNPSGVRRRFFEEPRHFRLGFGGSAGVLAEGLGNISRALAGFKWCVT